MDKGISPVIAVVLLVAIAVISAVGVWYWAGGLVSKPSGVDSTQSGIVIEHCRAPIWMNLSANGTNGLARGYYNVTWEGSEDVVRVRNTGSNLIKGQIPIYNATGQHVANLTDLFNWTADTGYSNFNIYLTPGEIKYADVKPAGKVWEAMNSSFSPPDYADEGDWKYAKLLKPHQQYTLTRGDLPSVNFFCNDEGEDFPRDVFTAYNENGGGGGVLPW